MTEYYDEKWLDEVEGKFEAIIAASQKARKINEGEDKDAPGRPKKVVVRALRQVVQGETGEETTTDQKVDESKEETPQEEEGGEE